MAKQKKAQRRLDPEDVIEGRARPGAQELLALIHDVNPSGHDLPARENARRYALKSRLQSLLVRRFPDEIVVEPGEAPGVVGLRHRASGADACHAVLATLDEDARSWVQMRIDLGEEEAAPSSAAPRSPPESVGPPSDAPLDELSTDELLSRGRAALAAYDYDAARERFSAAFDRGSREAALLLLTVLVEHLALDAEALRVEGRLDAEALRRSDVRVLLALAAARGYERDRAVRLVRADAGDEAAEVFVALGRGALERGELENAARDVAEIQRRGPSHPALLGLADTVKKRRAEERAPLEAEAQRLLAEGRFEEAEAKAAALAARWPESTVAHAVTRTVEERRRRAQARAMATEARAALDRGESAHALTLLRRAVALGLAGEEAAAAEKDMARAEAAERSREAWEKAADVVRVLREGHLQRGLVEYATLDDARRNMVKANAALPELVYLDQSGVRGAGPEVRAAVQAVMALKRALGMLDTDPAGALDVLTPHRAVLLGLEHGVKALEGSQALVDANHRLAAEQRLQESMTALHFDPTAGEGAMRDRMTRGLKLLASIRREHLDEGGRDLADRVTVSTQRMLERWDRAKVVGKLRKAGDLMRARDALDELIQFEDAGAAYDRPLGLEDDEEPRPAREFNWKTQRDDVVRALKKAAAVRVAGAPGPDASLGQEAPRLLHGVPTSVLPVPVGSTPPPSGREIVLVEAHGAHIFFQILDAEAGRVTRRASLSMTHDVAYARLQQHAGRACLLGRSGVMEVDTSSWEPHRAVAFAFSDQAGRRRRHRARPLHLVRLHQRPRVGDVLELRRRAGRLRQGVRRGGRARGPPPPPRAARAEGPRPEGQRQRPSVRAARRRRARHPARDVGAPPGRRRAPSRRGPLRARPRSGGARGADRRRPPPAGAGALGGAGAERRAEAGRGGAARRLEGFDPAAPYQVAAALDERMAFVLYTTYAGDRRLIGVGPRPGASGMELVFAVDVPPRLTLAQDAGARTAVALSPHDGGVEVVRLGASPPAFRAPAPVLRSAPGPPRRWAPGSRPRAPRHRAALDQKLWSMRHDGGYRLPDEYLLHIQADMRTGMIERTLGDRHLLVPRYAMAREVPAAAPRRRVRRPREGALPGRSRGRADRGPARDPRRGLGGRARPPLAPRSVAARRRRRPAPRPPARRRAPHGRRRRGGAPDPRPRRGQGRPLRPLHPPRARGPRERRGRALCTR